jgi:hypothetical protein
MFWLMMQEACKKYASPSNRKALISNTAAGRTVWDFRFRFRSVGFGLGLKVCWDGGPYVLGFTAHV